jgi:hypothetical protein
MNNTFRGFRAGYNNFNGGFKRSHFDFSRSFFQTKSSFNFMRMNLGNNFKIYFSNKNFMSKVLELNNCHPLILSLGTSSRSTAAISGNEDISDMDVGLSALEKKDGLVLFESLSLMHDDCMWTRCIPVGSGSHSL